jgi:hypothetical protein
MNLRIRELAVQAGLNAPYGSDHEGLRDFDYKKFAELIIQECCDVVRYVDAVEIKKHFGVE